MEIKYSLIPSMVLMCIQLSIRGGSKLQERGGWTRLVHGDVVCLRYVWRRELGVSPFPHHLFLALKHFFRAWTLVENGTQTPMWFSVIPREAWKLLINSDF